MTFTMILLAALSATAIVAVIRSVSRDGYGPVPTRRWVR
ncbi:hypothetical protein M2152_000596 [Microbacteriaceae bacterium SG_E_30_P1]|uniref:Uncharacterized protein n=1 Tax=Antiquaquibacter oligotrophicus TaxID=2880260 RepID=A0ABT6KML7_9MICO|nr:hypothetical protein [Antiquaquibacter oligotrophicus]